MPYNNAPISPPEEVTGSSALPSRVKKIIAMDEDIAQCSNGAAFAISVATEIFVRYLTEQAHNVVKSERKPRRNIAYKDIAAAVARIDNLEFLSDVVPKTQTYRQFKDQKAKASEDASKGPPPANGVSHDFANRKSPEQSRPVNSTFQEPTTNGHHSHTSPMADRTIHHSHPGSARDEDTEMSG